MSLSSLLPPFPCTSIPLLYLTLPELLALAKEDIEIAQLLEFDEFWYLRLQEYDASRPKYPRIHYYNQYALLEYMRGYTFELGQLCSPIIECFYQHIIKDKRLRTQYEIGMQVTEYYTLGISAHSSIRYYAALHHGDKKEICRLLGASEERPLAQCDHPPCVPCSREIIRHAIAFQLHTPLDVVRELVVNGQEKGLELVQYVLEEYASLLSIAALQEILNTSLMIIKRKEARKAPHDAFRQSVYNYSVVFSRKIHNAIAEVIIDASK